MEPTHEELNTYERFWKHRWRDLIGTILFIVAIEIWCIYQEALFLLCTLPFVIIGGLGIFYYFGIWRPLKKLRMQANNETQA